MGSSRQRATHRVRGGRVAAVVAVLYALGVLVYGAVRDEPGTVAPDTQPRVVHEEDPDFDCRVHGDRQCGPGVAAELDACDRATRPGRDRAACWEDVYRAGEELDDPFVVVVGPPAALAVGA